MAEDFRWARCSTHAIRNCTACWSVEKYGPMVPLPADLMGPYQKSSKPTSWEGAQQVVENRMTEHVLVSAAKVYADAEAKLNAAREHRRKLLEELKIAEEDVTKSTEAVDKAKADLVATLKI